MQMPRIDVWQFGVWWTPLLPCRFSHHHRSLFLIKQLSKLTRHFRKSAEARGDMNPTEFKTVPSQSNECVILLNGFPGVGKLSVARAIQSLLPEQHCRIVDNNIAIDAVLAVFPNRGPAYSRLRERVYNAILDELKEDVDSSEVLIMTACLVAGVVSDGMALERHMEIARYLDMPFFYCTVTCSKGEHLERLVSPGRVSEGKKKLDDQGELTAFARVMFSGLIIEVRSVASLYRPVQTSEPA